MGGGGQVSFGDGLLERERELAVVREAIDDAARGEGRLVVVRGGLGLGKTRLVAAVSEIAEETGMLVLAATAAELEGDLPFGVVMQLFQGVAVYDDDLLSGAAALAEPILRSADEPPHAEEDRGLTVQHGLYWLTSNLSDRGPLLLAVDDVHWSDEASLRYLGYLARRIGDLPVMVVITVRTGDPSPRQEAIDELTGLAGPNVLELEPLAPDSVGQLVRERLPSAEPEFCDACADVTRGNPLFLHEVLGELEDQGVAPTKAASTRMGQLAVDSISRMALRRIGRLEGAAADVARAVAVLGEDASPTAIAHVAGLDELAVEPALDALAGAEVLAPGGRCSFAHPLIRTSVYSDITPADREAMHLRAAEAIRDEGKAADRVANHLLNVPPGGRDWVASALRTAAARAVERGAPDAAVPFAARALEEPPPEEVRAALLVELGEAEAAAGMLSAADRFEAAVGLVETPEQRANLEFLLGRRLSLTGRYQEGMAAFERALGELGDSDGPLRAQVEAGYVTAARLNVETRPAAIERMNALAERIDGRPPSDIEQSLFGNIAFEKAVAGEPRDEVMRFARLALRGGAAASGTADGTGYYSAATALAWCDELEEADAAFAAAIEEAQKAGSVLRFSRASAWRAWVLHRLGRIPQAIANAGSALEHRGYGPDVAGPATNAALAMALLDRGEPDEAGRALELEDEERWSQTAPFAYYLDARGWLALERNRADEALADFEACGRLLEGLRVTSPSLVTWQWGAAAAAARSEAPERARAAVESGLAAAREFGAPRALGLLLLARGLVEPAEDAALGYLEESVAALGASQARLDHARALLELGARLRRAGRDPDAREPLRMALDRAHRCGASGVEERARAELVAAGGRPRRAVLTGAEALTPGERRVAEMAASGMTNREIAQALFVTMKAVGWHLRHVYRKLDISDRAEIGRRLGEGSQDPTSPGL